MSDLISRQAALMEARPEYMNPSQQGHEDYNQGWNDAISEYYTGIKMLPSAEQKTGWIPVSEELPSKGQVVLAIGDKGTWDVGKFQGTAGWTDDERMWLWKKKTVKRVDYWMPKDAIPLPNREDGE